MGDAKIFELQSELEVRATVLQPFPLSLSSDKERAQKVMSRFEAVPLLLRLRAFGPRYGGPPEDSFRQPREADCGIASDAQGRPLPQTELLNQIGGQDELSGVLHRVIARAA